jgi:hypothetical protein
MKLSETTFEEFIDWCKTNKKHWSTETQYVTIPKLKIIYDYFVKHNMECKGRRCTVAINGKWNSSYTSPLEYEPTREDFVWNMFHEVWCKTEWAVRCSRTPQELGYDAVKADFGMKMIKALKEVN